MTKKEFAQRVAIALAGNPRFTSLSDFSVVNITESADRLADYFEDHSFNSGFDDMSDGELIRQALDDIEEEMEREFDIENNIE